jgi:hypothetical protein
VNEPVGIVDLNKGCFLSKIERVEGRAEGKREGSPERAVFSGP